MALDALLFDIDGTLLDTNSAHVEAWRLAFESRGYRVGIDRIQEEIGKGGDKLVAAVLGQDAEERDGDALRQSQPKHFAELGHKRGFPLFPGALELLQSVRQRGLQVVLATSSSKQNLRKLEEISGVDLHQLSDLIVTADDAQESKPAPDIIKVSLRKLGLSAAQCAMIGDTLYDMQAAKHAGVIGLGVETGFQSSQTLLQNGARAVYPDVAAILFHLGEVLRIASPSPLHLTKDRLEALMQEALIEAQRGLESGEAPIGSVIADGNGQIISRGFNECNRSGDSTAHAEMVAFRRAGGRLPIEPKAAILVSTLEPCVMCLGAAMQSAIDTVVYGLRAPADSGTGRVAPSQSPDSQMPRIVGEILSKESRRLFQRFAETVTNPQQRAFCTQLLELTAEKG